MNEGVCVNEMRTIKLLLVVAVVIVSLCVRQSSATEQKDDNHCGENVTWRLEGDTLIINGTGAMDNFGYTDETDSVEQSHNG